MIKRKCPVCKKWLTYNSDNFFKNKTNKSGLDYECKPCKSGYRIKARIENNKKILDFKKNHKCQVCGYNKVPEILVFHHKTKPTIRIIGRYTSWEKIEAEIKKCLLLCPNCHAIEHLISPKGRSILTNKPKIMTTTFDKLLRENYLKGCLKEYAENKDSYPTRQDYLEARKAERNLHKEEWRKEDENN